MEHEDAAERLAELPLRGPKRRFTASDVGLMFGTALLLSMGAFSAGVGHLAGLLFSLVAALGIISIRSSRVGRIDEPALKKWTHFLSIGVSVFIFVYTFGMWRNSPMGITFSLGATLIPLLVYGAHLIALFPPRR